MAISLKGVVKTQAGTPIEDASVRLIGTDQELGDVRSAAVRGLDEVTWTRPLTGFSGNRWNCWQKFVMNEVAGITWEEFREQVVEHNPILIADNFEFKANKEYVLPEQAAVRALDQVSWTRTLTNFIGNRWDCWKAFVQGKVEGITWEEFKDEVVNQNPDLAADGFIFRANKRYRLPENVVPEEASIAWTRPLTNFSGNRWQCWEAHVRDEVDGITWGDFMTTVVEHNPDLPADGYVFKAGKTYWLPENRTTPVYNVFTVTDAAGRFAFAELTTAGVYELFVQGAGYHRYRKRLSLEAGTAHQHDVMLTAIGPGMTSHWERYPTAPLKLRKLIDQGLGMLGDDPVVFDTLSPEMKSLAFGSNFVNDPSHFHYKDIVCADLVTICLAAAGLDFDWEVTVPAGTAFNTHFAANYFRPRPDHPKLREVAENEAWLPGDILIYWNGDLETNRILHVNLYVGPFSGTDLSGNVHPREKEYDVVNASIDFKDPNGVEVGTAIRPVTNRFCLTNRFGRQHVRRMRHVDLEAELLGPDTRDFVQVAGDQFVLNGQPFRFVGANIRGLVHYGDPDILPHSRREHRDVQLQAATDMGARVVRVFLGNRYRTTAEVIARLRETLAKADQHDVYLIVAFTDVHGDTGFNPRGDERYYTQKGMLNKQFFASGYQENYMPFVESVVREFRNEERILAWELGNELKAWETIDGFDRMLPELFISFAHTVTKHIRELDPVHLIATGIINSENLGCNPAQAERLCSLANVNFLTGHVYHGVRESDPNKAQTLAAQRVEQERAERDADRARRLNKPFIIEEIGFLGGDRVQRTRRHFREWVHQRDARGFLQWGLMATHHDMGDGDSQFGIDPVFHDHDFERLVDAFRTFAADLA